MSWRFDLDPDLVNIKEIPILVEDGQWLDFYNTCKSPVIKRKYVKLAKLLSAKEEAIKNVQTVKRDKKKSFNTIFMLSQQANNEEDERVASQMESQKGRVEALNARLVELAEQKTRLKEQIMNANFSLLKETVRTAYKEIRKREKAQKDAEAKIDSLKKQLNDMIDKKHGFEEEKSNLYRLVHALIGKEETNKLDESFLE